MTPSTWRDRIRHIIDAATAVCEFTEGMTYERFIADRLTMSAIAYQITIIAEGLGSDAQLSLPSPSIGRGVWGEGHLRP